MKMNDIFKSNTSGRLIKIWSTSNYVVTGLVVYFKYIDAPDARVEHLLEKDFNSLFTAVEGSCEK